METTSNPLVTRSGMFTWVIGMPKETLDIIGVRPRATEVEDVLRDAIEDARKLRDQALGVLLAP